MAATEFNIFWSESKKRYLLKYKTAEGWQQKAIPKEVVSLKAAKFWAEQWLAEQRASGGFLRGGKPASPLGFTVREKVEDWKALRKGRSYRASTRAQDAGDMEHHILPRFGDDVIGAIEVSHIREFIRELKKKIGFRRTDPLSGSRIRNIRTTLTLFLDDAIAEGWCAKRPNPARDAAIEVELPPAKKRGRKKPLHLAAEAVQAVLHCDEVPVERQIRAMFGCLGLRDGEIAGLRFSKLFLDAPVPYAVIDEAVAMVGETGYATAAPTKTDASDRRVPLPPALVAALRWWWAAGWALTYGKGKPERSAILFPGKRREMARPKSADLLRKDLKTAGQADRQGDRVYTFHMLRASCATWLDERGVDEPTIGALLGHEGETVTRRNYTDATLRRLAQVVALVPLVWYPPGDRRRHQTGTSAPLLDRKTLLLSRVLSAVKDPVPGWPHQTSPAPVGS